MGSIGVQCRKFCVFVISSDMLSLTISNGLGNGKDNNLDFFQTAINGMFEYLMCIRSAKVTCLITFDSQGGQISDHFS